MTTHDGTTSTTTSEAQEQPKRVGRRGLVAGAAAIAVGMAAATVEKATAANGDPLIVSSATSVDNGATTALFTDSTVLSSAMLRLANYAVGSLSPPSNTRIAGYGFTNNNGATGTGDTGATAVGLLGNARNATSATNAIGVYGISSGYGVVGTTTGASYGVYGLANVPGSVAFAGGASVASAYAAVFGGQVVINGSLSVTGAKSAAVPHPDGSHRLVYCVEAPESWLEDFGTGRIVAGRAEVTLDPDFLAVADTKELHAFVTPHDSSHQLAVTQRSGRGFTAEVDAAAVTARGKRMTDVNGTFSYRVVARRKDIPANRLAKVTIPKVRTDNPIGPFTEDRGEKK